jgi:hypothetical protein
MESGCVPLEADHVDLMSLRNRLQVPDYLELRAALQATLALQIAGLANPPSQIRGCRPAEYSTVNYERSREKESRRGEFERRS